MVEMKTIQVHSITKSGSTMLGLMLAHTQNKKGIATGDLYHAFVPHQPIQRNREPYDGLFCVCDLVKNPQLTIDQVVQNRYLWSEIKHIDSACQVWRYVYEEGMRNIYDTLNKQGFDLVVSTSKEEEYYKIVREGWENTSHVLIYKHPYDYAYSFWKRGHKERISQYETVHKQILARLETNNNLVVIGYEQLAKKPAETLEKLCNQLGIRYFPGKEKFWNDPHPHLHSGSYSTIRHLLPAGSPAFESHNDNRNIDVDRIDPSIEYYREIVFSNSRSKLPGEVKQKMRDRTESFKIYKKLQEMSITSDGSSSNEKYTWSSSLSM